MHQETSQDLLLFLLVLHSLYQSAHGFNNEKFDLLVFMGSSILARAILLVGVDQAVQPGELSLEKRPKGPLVYTYRHLIPEIILILLQI